MRIVIDTREQKPLEFGYPFVTETYTTKLDVGDYTCVFEDGYFPKVVFERKSKDDLYNTLGKGHKRFKKEIQRAKDLDVRMIIIIESTMTRIIRQYQEYQIKGETLVKQLMTLWLKYDLYPVFCRDRNECANYIYQFYCAIGRMKVKKDGKV